MTVTADAHGNVKGFASNPVVELPPNADGHLNVGGALDLGILSVIKDMGLKEPYVGQCQLQTGEIAEDLTYYFATSEQIPSAVGLGVLMNKDCKVLGTLSIRGAIDPALIAMMRKMPAGSPHSPSPESEARWAAAASHPDAEDLAKAKSFMQGFLAMYDKFLKMM